MRIKRVRLLTLRPAWPHGRQIDQIHLNIQLNVVDYARELMQGRAPPMGEVHNGAFICTRKMNLYAER